MIFSGRSAFLPSSAEETVWGGDTCLFRQFFLCHAELFPAMQYPVSNLF